MKSVPTFNGWSLENWSIREQLLELNFQLRPVFETETELKRFSKTSADKCFWARGLFSRPTRIAFVNFTASSVVTDTSVSERDDQSVSYRLFFEKDAILEIEAENFTSIQW